MLKCFKEKQAMEINSNKSIRIFKALADETRFHIVCSLMEASLSVGAIAANISMSVSAVSHQLKLLKEWSILKSERKGKEIYYSLNDHHIKEIIEQVNSHAQHV
jgi:ArsR family transcriptional regulator, zinc-responsive transcriptional repressor